MYFIIAIAIIVFSVLTVTSRRILRTATYLLFVLFATAGIYFQLVDHGTEGCVCFLLRS